ncbi:MAG: M4 family metallopeptidase [Saprospiraceae bacterium]
MKLLLYSVMLWLLAAGTAFAQSNPDREPLFYSRYGNPDWLTVAENVNLTATELVQLHLRDLGLGPNDELRRYRTDTDDLGFTHYRYQQYHRSVPVDGAELLIHEKDGRVHTLNGKLVRGLDIEVRPTLPGSKALQLGLQHLPAQRYMWESPEAEALLRRIRQNPSATFFPKPELVLVAPGFTRNAADFQLAWQVEIFAEQPSVRRELFISAANGSILEEADLLHDQNTPGTAETKYSSTRPIVTDSMDTNLFRLVETTRGNGIETYNMQRGTEHADAVDFLDDDNNWNNVNPEKDEVATDAHWGAEMTFDYFSQKHNHPGVNGNNMALISFVHYDENWVNAQWTGDWARFGDGNGASYGPLTSLDVVGHEFVHGITQFTANLRYRNESGALNESFSDIFGTAIELWAAPERGDWLIGEDFALSTASPFRNMADPKKEENPDTYKGEHWVFGTADNGGVHTNSGVQNHWFYLLTAGGSGKNDLNLDYSVSGLGLDTAAAIAFRNLKYYLVRLSEYADAREGALQSAEDIYGPCSTPFQETANAWYAVGVGKLLSPFDLKAIAVLGPTPIECGLTGTEPVSVQLRYSGCNADLPAGTKIPMAYQVEDHPVVWDTLTLAADLTAADTLNFTFSAPPAEFATPGTYHLRCWTGLGDDLNLSNNELLLTVESIAEQNTDVRLQAVSQPVSGCMLGFETPEVEIGYWGCDPLPEGTEIQVTYRVNGGAPVAEMVQTPQLLNTGEAFKYSFSNPADLFANGDYDIDVWVNFGPDGLNQNDSLFNLHITNPAPVRRNQVLTFEADQLSLDSVFRLEKPGYSRGEISADAARTGAYGYRITGGDIDKAFLFGEAVIPNNDNVWNVNQQFRSKLCLCADLSGMASAELQFEHKQTYSFFYLNKFGYNLPYFSSLRVVVNGDVVSPTYKPITPNFDSWRQRKFDLDAYLGKTAEICFETLTGISPELDTFSSDGDRVLLDNIAIVSAPVTGTAGPAAAEPDWSVMPNPGTGLFTIDIPAERTQPVSISVSDALGSLVYQRQTTLQTGDNRIALDMRGMAPGMYSVQIGLEQYRYARRLVLQP